MDTGNMAARGGEEGTTTSALCGDWGRSRYRGSQAVLSGLLHCAPAEAAFAGISLRVTETEKGSLVRPLFSSDVSGGIRPRKKCDRRKICYTC
jgi:hypothetical protein